jgi:hypothetical protein
LKLLYTNSTNPIGFTCCVSWHPPQPCCIKCIESIDKLYINHIESELSCTGNEPHCYSMCGHR